MIESERDCPFTPLRERQKVVHSVDLAIAFSPFHLTK